MRSIIDKGASNVAMDLAKRALAEELGFSAACADVLIDHTLTMGGEIPELSSLRRLKGAL